MQRITSLDGLRAISIALVVMMHAYQTETTHSARTPLARIFSNGGLGVEIFFVISGFLVTTLLLREQASTGRISLSEFYRRRFYRIIPPFYAYLATIAVLAWTVGIGVRGEDLLRAATFVWNYSLHSHAWQFDHSWSLSVEEQFYLLWPPLLLWCGVDRRIAARCAWVLIAVAPGLRVLSHLAGPPISEHLSFMFHTRVDALMFGCLAAFWFGTRSHERFARAHWALIAALCAFVFVVSPVALHYFGGAYLYTVGYSLEGACIALILVWLVANPSCGASRLLATRPIVHLGLISYSLYIWQALFLSPAGPFNTRWYLNVFFSLVLAELSYRWIERPIQRSRRRPRPATAAGHEQVT